MNPKHSKLSGRRVWFILLLLHLILVISVFARHRHYYRPFTQQQKHSYCKERLAGRRFHAITRIMKKFNRPVTVLDVGANTGPVTLPALYCLPIPHSMLSIEPVPLNAHKLIRNVRRMGNALAEKRFSFRQVAFSNVSESTTIYVPEDRPDNSALSRRSSTANIGRKHPLREITVQLRRGDDLIGTMIKELRDARTPEIVKIDTQGQEPRVLKGMSMFLSQHRDDGLFVLAEHDRGLLKASGFSPYPVYDIMTALGYKVYCKPNVTVTNDGLGDLRVDGIEWTRDEMNTKRCDDLVYWAGKK